MGYFQVHFQTTQNRNRIEQEKCQLGCWLNQYNQNTRSRDKILRKNTHQYTKCQSVKITISRLPSDYVKTTV